MDVEGRELGAYDLDYLKHVSTFKSMVSFSMNVQGQSDELYQDAWALVPEDQANRLSYVHRHHT